MNQNYYYSENEENEEIQHYIVDNNGKPIFNTYFYYINDIEFFDTDIDNLINSELEYFFEKVSYFADLT